jgi:hypothetical protein
MAKISSYATRALRAQDPRFAKIFGKLGYETRDEVPAVAPRRAAVQPAAEPVKTRQRKVAEPAEPTDVPAITTDTALVTKATETEPVAEKAKATKPAAKPEPAPNSRKAKALLDSQTGMSFFEFKAAAGKILGADTPAKKADIIEALQALAGKA